MDTKTTAAIINQMNIISNERVAESVNIANPANEIIISIINSIKVLSQNREYMKW